MFQAIGMETGRLFAAGTRADCLRKLHEMFPSCDKHYKSRTLPELIQVVKA